MRLFKNYTPPSFAELEEILGPESEQQPFENMRLYDLMVLAMRHHTYTRNEAFKRLHNMAKSKNARQEAINRLLAAWAANTS